MAWRARHEPGPWSSPERESDARARKRCAGAKAMRGARMRCAGAKAVRGARSHIKCSHPLIEGGLTSEVHDVDTLGKATCSPRPLPPT